MSVTYLHEEFKDKGYESDRSNLEDSSYDYFDNTKFKIQKKFMCVPQNKFESLRKHLRVKTGLLKVEKQQVTICLKTCVQNGVLFIFFIMQRS